MKKIFNLCAFVLTIALCSSLFVGCGSEPTELASNLIQLEYTSVEYDGIEKKPTVKVVIDEEEISSDEYTVEYSKNINVGTATVKVLANEDSKVLSGSVSVGFEIVPVQTTAATIAELEAGLNSSNFSEVKLNSNLEIESGETLTIPAGKTVKIENKVLTNNGTFVNEGVIDTDTLIVNNGTFTNDGEYVVNVDTYQELKDATHKATKIVLTANIVGSPTADYELFANNSVGDLNLVLDLNGKSIESSVYIVAKDNKKMNLTIKNGTVFSKGTDEDYAYALAIKSKAQTKGDVVIKVEDVTAYSYNSGIQTNGLADQKNIILEAKNCTFGAVVDEQEYGYAMTETGGYFPGLHNYRFENCTFIGVSGVYAKSGYHKYINCNINGEGEEYLAPSFNKNGCNDTGSALVVDSSATYQSPLEVEVDGGTLTSKAGFAIEEIITYKGQPIDRYSEVTLKNNPVLTPAAEKDAIAALYVADASQVSVSDIQTTLTQMGTKAETLEAGSYSVEEFNAAGTESNFKFYICVGSILNDVAAQSFSMRDGSIYTLASKTHQQFGDVTIEDRVFYVDTDGKVYVAISTLKEEVSELGGVPTEIIVNGKAFAVPQLP